MLIVIILEENNVKFRIYKNDVTIWVTDREIFDFLLHNMFNTIKLYKFGQ